MATTNLRKAGAIAVVLASVALPVAARAYVVDPVWTHDHSAAGIPPRPSGYTQLVQTFGQPCSNAANDSRSYWPSQSARNVAGYVYYHPYIARDVGFNVRNHVAFAKKDGAVDYLVGRIQLPADPRRRRPGRRTRSAPPSTRTPHATRSARTTGSASVRTASPTARTCPTSGGARTPATASSGA